MKTVKPKQPHIHIVGHESSYDDSHVILETEDDFYAYSSPHINFYKFCPECGKLNNTKFRGKRWDRYHRRRAKRKALCDYCQEVPICDINRLAQSDGERYAKQLAKALSRPSPYLKMLATHKMMREQDRKP